MAALSDYLENALLNLAFHNTAYVPPVPGTVWVALYTSPTTDAGGGTEVGGGLGYARVSMPSANWTTASGAGGTLQNSVDAVFPTATAAWGTITHVAIIDNNVGGNFLWHGPLAASKVVGLGDTFRFLAGQLVVGLS